MRAVFMPVKALLLLNLINLILTQHSIHEEVSALVRQESLLYMFVFEIWIYSSFLHAISPNIYPWKLLLQSFLKLVNFELSKAFY